MQSLTISTHDLHAKLCFLLFPYRMTAYKQIPAACLQFTQEKGEEIVQKKIVFSFLAHLIGLCDFGLVTPSDIKSCMDTLETLQPS